MANRLVELFEPVQEDGKFVGKKKVAEGEFHGFGLDFIQTKEGVGNFSTALVELEDGNVKNWDANYIKFVPQQKTLIKKPTQNLLKVNTK